MDLHLVPLDDRREMILRFVGRIQPAEIHQIKENLDIAAQFHQMENLPAPKIVLEKFPRYLSFSWKGEQLTTDPCWHEPLQFVTAKQLRDLRVEKDDSKNIAMMASIAALPPETRILIWWSGAPPEKMDQPAPVAVA